MSASDAPSPEVDRGIPENLGALYQEVILDHYRRPRNKGELGEASHTVTMNNPLCGDVIQLDLKIEGGRIAAARFRGKGCSISQASASMLTGELEDRSIDDALELTEKFTRLMHGEAELARDKDLGDLRALSGVSKFPVRIKCALLGFNCLERLLGEEESASPDDTDPRQRSRP